MLGAVALASSVVATSCSDDDNGGAGSAVSISRVFLQDAKSETLKSREVDFARLGQTIRIEGSGFTGLKHILINGYDTYFNNALMTDNNVWVTLASKTPIVDAEESVRNTIVMVKDNGSYTYNFTIRAASPSVSNISITLPQPGDVVRVEGANLHETTSATLPDGTVVSDITNDVDGEWYSFVMPEGVEPVGGSIVSEGANGIAKSPDCFNVTRGMILDFDGQGVQGSWSATFSSEDLVDDPLGKNGKCIALVPASQEGGYAPGANSKGWFTAGNDVDPDWTTLLEGDASEISVEDVALQFDIYCPEPWKGTGQIMFTFQNNISSYGWGNVYTSAEYNSAVGTQSAVVWVPWMNEETGAVKAFQTDGWQTITIPVSKIGKYQNGGTWADVAADRLAGSYCNFGMFFCNGDIEFSESIIHEASRFDQRVYIDNWRIVPYHVVTVSDFE